MSFGLSQDHEAFRKVVRDFAETEIGPNIERWEAAGGLPTEAVRAMGELGLFGLTAAEEYGGAGGDLTSLCVALEEIGRVDQSIGITLEAAVGLGINPIATYGTAEQKERWLPDLVAGRALAGFGLTEPEAGSDAGATRTRAALDGDEWVRRRRQGLHHELGPRADLAGHRHRADGHDVRGGRRDLHDRRPRRHARVHRRGAVPQARLAPVRHAPALLRRRPRAGGEPAGRPAGAASRSSSPRWTTAASRSPRSRSASRRPASTTRSSTRRPGRRSASRSGASRASRSSSPTCRSRSRRPGCSRTRLRGSRTRARP